MLIKYMWALESVLVTMRGDTLIQFKGSRVSLKCHVCMCKPYMQVVKNPFLNKRVC